MSGFHHNKYRKRRPKDLNRHRGSPQTNAAMTAAASHVPNPHKFARLKPTHPVATWCSDCCSQMHRVENAWGCKCGGPQRADLPPAAFA